MDTTTLASEEENDVRMREMAERFLPGINEFYRITEISVEENGPNRIQRVTVTGLNRQTVKGLFGRRPANEVTFDMRDVEVSGIIDPEPPKLLPYKATLTPYGVEIEFPGEDE